MKAIAFKEESWRGWLLTILRVAVGWHLFYEGASKLISEDWTATQYLAGSTGFLSAFYQWLADSPMLMLVVDFLNIYGLLFIGLGLCLGYYIRLAASAGAILMGLYYFAYPPFGASAAMQVEGNLFVVNRLLIEGVILLLFVFLRDTGFGLDRLVARRNRIPDAEGASTGRREVLKDLAAVPLLGLLGYGAVRDKLKYGYDTMSGATIQVGGLDLSELKGELPKGKIGNLELSRLVLGGNLIGGWAHARDLLYVSSLMKAYNTEKRIFDTLQLAEQAGIDSINIGFKSHELLAKYKRLTGSPIKVICQVAPDRENEDWYVNIDKAIDAGMDVLQLQGNHCDWLVRDRKTEVVGLMLEYMRSQGYIAGLGAHSVDALIACTEAGIIPDFYMKTLHHDQYWSAHPKENRIPFEVDGKRYLDHNRFHDNIFCLYPDRSVDFVKNTEVPVMGFKVLAAGAIKPEDGFRWAFENGADFICVGMLDFQIVKNINTTLDILNDLNKRERAWYA